MENIIKKIKSNKKIDIQDLEKFILYQANKHNVSDYVTDFAILYPIINKSLMEYELRKKRLVLYPNSINNSIKLNYKNLSSCKLNLFKKRYNDYYNLLLLFGCFHELTHISQYKFLNSNSILSSLTRTSFNIIKSSKESYKKYHDLYYVEYNANINAIFLLNDFIEKNCKNTFSRRTLELLNKYFAKTILSGYGYYANLKNNDISPIDNFKFLFSITHYNNFNDNDIKILNRILNNKEKYIKNDINDLINGFKLPSNVLEKIFEVSTGKYKTVDLINELKNEFSKEISTKIK